MKTMTRRAAVLAAALAVSLGAAACAKDEAPPTSSTSVASDTASGSATTGSSNADAPSAANLIEKAKTTTLAATSGAFKGEVEQNGQKMKIDFKGTNDGKTSDVNVEMEGQGKVRVIVLGEDVYMQADETFWKSQGAPQQVLDNTDKFVKAPASAAGMTESLSMERFLDEAFGDVTASKVSADVGSETINGVDCWVLTDKAGKDQGALYIDKSTSNLVRFTGSATSPGVLDFSDWNADLGIEAPPADQIMSLTGATS